MSEDTSPWYYCFECQSEHTVAFGEEFHGRVLDPHLLRLAQAYDLSDDALPLHPDFWQFIQKDERGYFITDDVERWDVVLIETR